MPKERKNKPRALVSSNNDVQRMIKNASADVALSGQPTFFSPLLSTDFLQLPQTQAEKRILIHHFYKTDPIVGQSIDLHGELPLSKVRLAKPKVFNNEEAKAFGFESANDRAEYILDFYVRMCKRVKLFQALLEISHHWNLDGDVFIWAEDTEVEVPEGEAESRELTKEGVLLDKVNDYIRKEYKGWKKLVILAPDTVKVESYQFSDDEDISIVIDAKTKRMADEGLTDEESQKRISKIPPEILEYIEAGEDIPLGTDPNQGSFVYHLSRKKASYEDNGIPLAERCLRTLIYREKLRQTQTQIADRAMTPKRLIWAEDLSDDDVSVLREQVDTALLDPDFSIITNYEVHWQDIGARDRLLDLNSEYERTDEHLYIGMGVTKSLLVGETSYGGDRLRVEVINTRYLLFREIIQQYVEDYLFAPVARKKGFVEHDKWGNVRLLFPSMQFTRLALRDSQDTYDQLFNLYQKGSVPIEVIYDLLNLDAEDCRSQIEKGLFTVNDSVFNELIRNLYDRVADQLTEGTDLKDKLMKSLGLKNVEEELGGGGSSMGGGSSGGLGGGGLPDLGEIGGGEEEEAPEEETEL